MKTIELISNQIRHYKLDVPDENYTKVVELLGKPSSPFFNLDDGTTYHKVTTDVIKQYPVAFPISKFFSEELHSLCECDITDESYSLRSDDLNDFDA
jgi:hypothetical protein